jgi:N-acetylmuramoyl-L-alanine amidase
LGTRLSGGQLGTLGLLVIAVVLGIIYVLVLSGSTESEEPTPTSSAVASATRARPTRTPRPTRTRRPTATPKPTPTPTPGPLSIGVVAGHWQSDSGAICDDGLQEVTINLEVASLVVAFLQEEGYDAELLPEFTDKLDGYLADAFVSIHADACNVPGASGFKVARVAASAIPEEEDRLVACLIREYSKSTGLRFHKNSITHDMTVYHAFNEIDPQTPGAIIELGFLGADRELLTENTHEVARGVVQGIVCFLESD